MCAFFEGICHFTEFRKLDDDLTAAVKYERLVESLVEVYKQTYDEFLNVNDHSSSDCIDFLKITHHLLTTLKAKLSNGIQPFDLMYVLYEKCFPNPEVILMCFLCAYGGATSSPYKSQNTNYRT